MRPREYVCVDVLPVQTREALAQLFVAVDAYSYYVMGFHVSLTATIEDYIAFLDQVGQRHDLSDDVTLICDLQGEQREALLSAFPFLRDVECDPDKAASITSDFRTYFLARLAEGATN